MEIGCEKHTIVRENSTKPGKLVLIFFRYYEWFLPIRFLSYGIFYHMGIAWVSPLISHSMVKRNKTQRLERTWEIGTHTFYSMSLFPHLIPILWYTSWHRKRMVFLLNFPKHWKIQQNSWSDESLGNWYSYFSHRMSAFCH